MKSLKVVLYGERWSDFTGDRALYLSAIRHYKGRKAKSLGQEIMRPRGELKPAAIVRHEVSMCTSNRQCRQQYSAFRPRKAKRSLV
jgi:hypothetical protein